MAREHHLPPSAASLSASMRDLGYSLETAIADLIDNSISANATSIEIYCDPVSKHPTFAIVDNGSGMTSDELVLAMKHGSASPKAKRDPNDLGRFGLGLKTASFSQCRRLTIASVRGGRRCGAEWDLNLVDKRDEWLISILDDEEVSELPYFDRIDRSGTIVVWRDLDRLFETEIGHKREELVYEKLDVVEKHLALVFHRFISGEVRGRKKITISINGHTVQAFDPFCRKNSSTQMLPQETVRINGQRVNMQPYVLPHHSRLSAHEFDFYQDRSDFISNQGAYIYRCGRLMAWGDWFRLIPKGEATKLARIQIDFPNSLDEAWTIDIRKSRARPPQAVKERLRQVIDRIAGRGASVHQGRGRKIFDEVNEPVWERYADHGKIRYELNRDHTLVQFLEKNMNPELSKNFELFLDAISASVPVEMIYSDFSTHPRDFEQVHLSETEVLERLETLKSAIFNGKKPDASTFREFVDSLRIFAAHSDIVNQYIAEELE